MFTEVKIVSIGGKVPSSIPGDYFDAVVVELPSGVHTPAIIPPEKVATLKVGEMVWAEVRGPLGENNARP